MGHETIVEILLARNLIPDPLALIASSAGGHTLTVQRLLDNIHIKTMDKSVMSPALRDAAKGGHAKIVKMLIDFGVQDAGALSAGIASGDAEVVGLLLMNGAVPRGMDWAAAKKFPAIRQRLKEAMNERRKAAFGVNVKRMTQLLTFRVGIAGVAAIGAVYGSLH
ncbi:hypothetical protein HDU67_005862 [Dinochytrium kinnereticum]|nr:hypothetical protein HDU67_005862 [Dinochytrium kinnereticum]